MRRRQLLALPGLVALAAAGCAQPGFTGGTADVGVAEAPQLDGHSLDNWRDFPADRHPRPVVLLNGPVKIAGFRTGEAKLAAIEAGYSLAGVTLPADPPARLPVTLPDGPTELATVNAATAFDTLQQFEAPEKRTGTPLPVTGVVLGAARFRTDRGEVALPAWMFSVQDGLEPFAVVALAPAAFWRFMTALHSAGPPVTLGADGRTLRVPLPQGSGCTSAAPVAAEVVESAAAVAIGPQPVSPDPQPEDCRAPAILRFAEVTVRLAASLAGRVLVDGQGNPFEVRPA
jgi:hypothetical protein